MEPLELTKCELEVMNVIWCSDKPVSKNDIIASNCKRTWNAHSFHILINGLLTKGFIQECGIVKSGKTNSRQFSATVSFEEYYTKYVLANIPTENIPSLVAAVLDRYDIPIDTITKLQATLQEKKSK